jgi:hypothetical protein
MRSQEDPLIRHWYCSVELAVMHKRLQGLLAVTRLVPTSCALAAAFMLLLNSCSVDRGIGPTTQGIRGAVTFEGSWPDSVQEARVAVLRTYPAAAIADLAGFGGEIEPGADEALYAVEVSQGTYPFVGVVCRTGAEWDATSIKCVLGYYEEPGSQGGPAAVNVVAGAFTDSMDIIVRFAE